MNVFVYIAWHSFIALHWGRCNLKETELSLVKEEFACKQTEDRRLKQRQERMLCQWRLRLSLQAHQHRLSTPSQLVA